MPDLCREKFAMDFDKPTVHIFVYRPLDHEKTRTKRGQNAKDEKVLVEDSDVT